MVTVLLQIVFWFWRWKNFENQLTFGETIKCAKNGAIFWPTLYSVGQKSKLLHFVHIFAKYWLIFTIFLLVDSVKKFAAQWHAHHTYYVTTLPCKI